MATQEQTILLVSDDASLCAAARREFEAREQGLRVAAVSNIEAARRILEDATPVVILLEEAPLAVSTGQPARETMPLAATVSSLARYAPVVVIGEAAQQSQISALIAAGAADFVPRTDKCLSTALGLVGRRLDFVAGNELNLNLRFRRPFSQNTLPKIPQASSAVAPSAPSRTSAPTDSSVADASVSEAFGEVLRHELNNPLTGILGNAELLLAEVRRKSDGKLPPTAQQRLETIAALAVRLRETVRRLSQDWESRQSPAR